MFKYLKVLYVQVLIAIMIGILLGHFYPQMAVKMQPLGKMFINLIKMIIAPLIFSTVVTGIAGMNDIKAVGKTGGLAIIYFTGITLLALVIGLVVVNLVPVSYTHLLDEVLVEVRGSGHSRDTLRFLQFRPATVLVDVYKRQEDMLSGLHLHTVCQEAMCPNKGECFARGTSTFIILGDVCTRGCRYCAVGKGKPEPPDAAEPDNVAQAVQRMRLRHAVITSVTRDDLARCV